MGDEAGVQEFLQRQEIDKIHAIQVVIYSVNKEICNSAPSAHTGFNLLEFLLPGLESLQHLLNVVHEILARVALCQAMANVNQTVLGLSQLGQVLVVDGKLLEARLVRGDGACAWWLR